MDTCSQPTNTGYKIFQNCPLPKGVIISQCPKISPKAKGNLRGSMHWNSLFIAKKPLLSSSDSDDHMGIALKYLRTSNQIPVPLLSPEVKCALLDRGRQAGNRLKAHRAHTEIALSFREKKRAPIHNLELLTHISHCTRSCERFVGKRGESPFSLTR